MEEVAVHAHQLWKCAEDIRAPLPAVEDVSLRTSRGEADPFFHANQLVRDIVDVHLVPVKRVQPKQEGHVELDHVDRHDHDEVGGDGHPDVKAPDRIVLAAPELVDSVGADLLDGARAASELDVRLRFLHADSCALGAGVQAGTTEVNRSGQQLEHGGLSDFIRARRWEFVLEGQATTQSLGTKHALPLPP